MGRRRWAAAAIAGNPPLGRKWAQTKIANWENIQFCDLKVEVQHQNLLELPSMDGWMDGHNGYNGYNGYNDPFPHIFC